MSETLGIRLKNPGNIRCYNARWKGLVGREKGFCVFMDMRYGVRAMQILIMRVYRERYKLVTPGAIIAKYAPPTENNTDGYIKQVKKISGLDSFYKLHSDDDYFRLIKAMCWIESNYYLKREMFDEAKSLW